MQCLGVSNQKQCSRDAMDGSNYCRFHGGAAQLLIDRRQKLYDLNETEYLQKLSDRLEFFKNGSVLSLRNEIGILRVALERLLNNCKNDEQLLLRSGDVGNLVSKIESAMKTTHQLEKEVGELMTKEQAAEIAGKLISKIVEEFNKNKIKKEASNLAILGTLTKYNLSEEDLALVQKELAEDNSLIENIADGFGDVLQS